MKSTGQSPFLIGKWFFHKSTKKYVRVDPIWSDPRQRPKFRDLVSRMDWEAETREEWINDSIEGKHLDTMLHWTKELQVARHHSGSLQATRNVDSHISKTDYSSASRTLLSAVCSSITFDSFWRSFSILSEDSDWIYSSRDCIVLCAQCKRDGLFGSVLIICFVSAFVRREDRDERSEFGQILLNFPQISPFFSGFLQNFNAAFFLKDWILAAKWFNFGC